MYPKKQKALRYLPESLLFFWLFTRYTAYSAVPELVSLENGDDYSQGSHHGDMGDDVDYPVFCLFHLGSLP